MNIAKSIKVGMALKSISRKEFVDAMCVSSVTVSYWMHGHRMPSLERLKRIAKFFDVPVSTFIEWGEE